MGGGFLRIGPGPVVVGVDGEGQQRRQRRRPCGAHHQHGDVGAVAGAHQRIAINGVATRVIGRQRGGEQRLELLVRRMHLPGAHQIDRLGQRQARLARRLGQCAIQLAAHPRQVTAKGELRLQRDLVVQRRKCFSKSDAPGLRIREAALGLQGLGLRMDFVLQVQRRLARRIIAQGAQGADACHRLGVLARGQLQAEARAQVPLAIIVVVARQRGACQRGHGLVDVAGLQRCWQRHLRGVHRQAREHRDQQHCQEGSHAVCATPLPGCADASIRAPGHVGAGHGCRLVDPASPCSSYQGRRSCRSTRTPAARED
jgi:hypothetical protein